MFHKAFKTDTDNELGSFLESFIIAEEKNKLQEPSSYVQFSKRKYIPLHLFLLPISDTTLHSTEEAKY